MKKVLIGIVSFLILAAITFYLTSRPTATEDGAYMPSPLALKLATAPTTDFDNTKYENPYTGNKKIVEIVTPTGKPVKIEMWAMPNEDEHVKRIYAAYKPQFDNPGSLSAIVQNSLTDSSDYVAVYIPGGHGAMLGLPENKDLNKLIHWSHDNDLFMLSICHGPAALLAGSLDAGKAFPYKGYKIAAFPGAVDEQTPMFGYMPGHMPWKFGEKLNNLGVTIINEEADKTVHIDRKLITGAGPLAANDFGKLAANELLKVVNK